MIWRYHHFRKHPYPKINVRIFDIFGRAKEAAEEQRICFFPVFSKRRLQLNPQKSWVESSRIHIFDISPSQKYMETGEIREDYVFKKDSRPMIFMDHFWTLWIPQKVKVRVYLGLDAPGP